MVEQVVGLRFVVDGEREVANALKQVDTQVKNTYASQKQLEQSYESLRRSIDPLYGVQQRYNEQLKLIQGYHRQAGSSAQAMAKDIRALQDSYARAGTVIDQYGGVTEVAGTKANRLGLVMQQTGYQVGDFAVQVQSGTNVFVAFGQQATQLAGLLYLIPGGIGVIAGTVASILIPTLTGALAYFDRTGTSAKSMGDRVSELDAAIQKLSESNKMASMTTEELGEKYGGASSSLRSTIDLLNEIARSEAQEAIDGLSQAISELQGTRGDGDRRAGLADFFNANIFLAFTEAQRESRQEARLLTYEFVKQQEVLANSDGNLDAQIESLQILLKTSQQLADLDGARTSQERDLIKLLAERLLQMQEVRGVEGQIASEEERKSSAIREYYRSRINGEIAIAALNKESLNKIIAQNEIEGRRLEILESYNAKGQKTAQTLELEIALSNDVLRAKLLQEAAANGVTEAERAAVEEQVRLNEEAIRAQAAIDSAASSAGELASAIKEADSAMQSLAGFSANVDRALAISIAKVDALKNNADEAIAGQITGMLIDLESKKQAALAAGNDPIAVMAESAITESAIRALEASEAERKRIQEASRSSGRAGVVESGVDFTSRILGADFLEAINRAKEETALYQKEVQMLDSALSSGLITQSEYNSYVRQAQEAYGQAAQGAYDYEKAMNQVSNTAMSSMEDAFMSILDGSKSASDAFRDMARAIISEAMKMLVIRPLLQGIFGGGGGFLGGLLNANGNAFIGGDVTPFANGGVVGGPTTFPMSGGRTGLMGEAGPEAIMPLKRTSSGKLGVIAEGGGAVTVNNNINVQGDNAAAVRQEIAKLMPTITEATKSAVIDARRRGGQMRAAFS